MLLPGHPRASLTTYGWDDEWERLLSTSTSASASASAEPDHRPGRVARVDRGRVDVVTGNDRIGVAVPHDLAPAVGDWVVVAGDEPVLADVLPRRTALVRGSASGRSDGQVLAANVDTVLVVTAADAAWRPGRLERLLALAWESGARPVLVVTKTDLAEAAVDEAAAVAPGVDVVGVSAVTGDGLDVLRAVVDGTAVLLGPSGVGKSTLGNALLGDDVLATGAVRAVDGKGRHTTAHRELLPLPGGGVLVDTPGLRAIALHDAAEGIERAFADVEDLAEGCRFADCGHESEPGCAVLAAVDSGTLPGRRLDSYRKLRREDEWAASRTDARLAAERKARWKAVSKAQRAMYRGR